jgi:hypothetical protein
LLKKLAAAAEKAVFNVKCVLQPAVGQENRRVYQRKSTRPFVY